MPLIDDGQLEDRKNKVRLTPLINYGKLEEHKNKFLVRVDYETR